MHKQSRMKSKPKFMYGWLRIFLWYNWRYLHINFKLDSDDNNRKLCRDKYLPSLYIYLSLFSFSDIVLNKNLKQNTLKIAI